MEPFYRYLIVAMVSLLLLVILFLVLRRFFYRRERRKNNGASMAYAEMTPMLDEMLEEARLDRAKYIGILNRFPNGMLQVETPRKMIRWKNYRLTIVAVRHDDAGDSDLKPDARIKLADYMSVGLAYADYIDELDAFRVKTKGEDHKKHPLLNMKMYEKKIIWQGSVRPLKTGWQNLEIPIRLYGAEKEEEIDTALKIQPIQVKTGTWSFWHRLTQDRAALKSAIYSAILSPVIVYFIKKLADQLF